MKVHSSQLDENRRQIKKLIDKQRNQIALREQELDNIQKIYKKQADEKKLNGEQELLDIHDRNQHKLVEATKEKEHKLGQLRDQFKMSQDSLAQREFNLKNEHNRRIIHANEAHQVKTTELFDKAQEDIKEINFNTNNKIRDIHSNTTVELGKIRHKSQLAIDKAAYDNDLKVTQAQNGQADAMKKTQQRYQLQARQQEMEHKNALDQQILKNQSEFQTRQRIHKDKSEATKAHYDELMKSEKRAFEVKYKKMIDEHKSVLDRLKESFQKRMQGIVKSNSKEHQMKATKSADQFYDLATLRPRLREDLNFYYVDIDTPKHEKENYHLTAHGRKIKLKFNRRNEERLESLNGTIETSNRSETMSKEFKVKHIVDDKNLKVAYENGVLSYRLPKA